MENLDHLAKLGLFDARVPRYTSYPPATVFSDKTGSQFQTSALKDLDPDIPVSVYVHIPFCERLCWFCACRTQGTQTLNPVARYLETLSEELDLLRALLPRGLKMGRLHWGGGTPTILPPEMIHNLAGGIKTLIPPAEVFEFSVEIDPTLVDDAKINALAIEGMSRASIGIQDFSTDVQFAIGRAQPFELTQKCVTALRDAGITSLNMDLVYGLPNQTQQSMTASIEKVLELDPDRVALFGYAHVPHIAKRQRMIDEAALPNGVERHLLFMRATSFFQTAGYEAIGIDHFAKANDELALSKKRRALRRNFQGYTTDTCPSLIGLGASSISRFDAGYVSNAAATAAYTQRINSGHLAGYRGHVFSSKDKLHARAIEMLMCDFEIDERALANEFGTSTLDLPLTKTEMLDAFPGMLEWDQKTFRIRPEGRALTRMIAQYFDEYADIGATYSKAS